MSFDLRRNISTFWLLVMLATCATTINLDASNSGAYGAPCNPERQRCL